jgi:hypothetical protein
MTTDEMEIEVLAPEAREFTKCALSFLYFLWPAKFGGPEDEGKHFIWIKNPTGTEIIPMEPWDYLVDIATDLEMGVSLSILKARQLGLSWLLAAYSLWLDMFHEAAEVVLMSQGEAEARELLSKTLFIYDRLPAHLQIKKGKSETEMVDFPGVSSMIRALPSTIKAGRSITGTLLVCDEHAHHPHAAENLTAAKPIIDAGAQMISVSTNDKKKAISTFKAVYKNAKLGRGKLKPIFLGCFSRPGRDQAWYDQVKEDIPLEELRRLGLTPQSYMEQEYPRTEEEALAPSTELSAIDQAVLKAMEADCYPPRKVIDGIIEIYREWIPGQVCVAFSDTSHGVGQDNSTTLVMDARSWFIMAVIMSAYLSPEELAYQSIRLLKMYDNPLWGIEDNDWGAVTISKAREAHYPNFFYREWQRAQKRTLDHTDNLVVGWHTGPDMNKERLLLYGELIPAVNKRHVINPCERGRLQLFDIIRDPAKNGRIGAMDGGNDDFGLALGGCIQMVKYADLAAGGGGVKYNVWGGQKKHEDRLMRIKRREEGHGIGGFR